MRRIRSDMTRLEGDRQATARAIERLEFEVVRRSIRPPAAGRLDRGPHFGTIQQAQRGLED